MRTVVVHARGYHPLAKASHATIPDVELIDVSGRHDAYQNAIGSLWSEKESFLLIEHDIEVTELALQEARECACLWGISPYNGPGLDLLYGSLGFVRFNKELMTDVVPNLIDEVSKLNDGVDIPPGHWRRLDVRIQGVLRQAGIEQHIHSPVLHHHVYRDVCACMYDHDDYAVDGEGRYQG